MPAAKPRFFLFSNTCTPGNCVMTVPAVPSEDALSTLNTELGETSFTTDSRQARIQAASLLPTTITAIRASWSVLKATLANSGCTKSSVSSRAYSLRHADFAGRLVAYEDSCHDACVGEAMRAMALATATVRCFRLELSCGRQSRR